MMLADLRGPRMVIGAGAGPRACNCLISAPANPATKPRMMPIKNLAKNGPVGVLKRCCTMTSERIDH